MAVCYFSYGANMSRYVLEKRKVRTSKPGVPGIAKDYVLTFSHRGGYATLIPLTKLLHSEEARWAPFKISPHGVLYHISQEEFAFLQEKEVGYQVTDILVQCYGSEEEEGKLIPAKAFVSSPLLLLFAAVAPPARYMAKIKQGADENGLCGLYRDWLANVRVATLHEVTHSDYNSTYADLGARCFGFALLAGITWALIN
uniref:Gamma-glutamylcyclotransferase n=1 Tax=Dunaliella tertiolecta TaxID=3047 RepID=A0A7S3VIZ4_DUNTE|mmetsp:Transcript_9073/g.24397  ORF Transcript_9073/g.24397 Transcript_9073/m.24397 type:complete len:199 (+) Transcript_9073:94-690(+)|eukprot:1153832-Pelagomonas_calceolata.AAC.3